MTTIDICISASQKKFKDKQIKQVHQVFHKYITNDLKKAEPYLNKRWKTQNNKDDKQTDSIVYKSETFDDLIYLHEKYNKGADFNYLVHRWYNLISSKTAERIFPTI